VRGVGIVDTMRAGRMASVASGGPWWDPDEASRCVWGAWQAKGAASLAASYIDLSGNGNNLTPGVAPAWDAVNGWKFNGSTHWLDTSFVFAADRSQAGLAQFTNRTNSGVIFGSYYSTTRGMLARPADGTGVRYSNCSQLVVAPQMGVAGNVGVSGSKGYRDGIADAGVMNVGTGDGSGRSVYLGALNWGGVNTPIAAYCQAFVIYDCTLSAAQVLAVVTAMAAI